MACDCGPWTRGVPRPPPFLAVPVKASTSSTMTQSKVVALHMRTCAKMVEVSHESMRVVNVNVNLVILAEAEYVGVVANGMNRQTDDGLGRDSAADAATR